MIKIFALPSWILAFSASAENAEKTTEWIAPIRVQASIAIRACGTIGKYIETTSPFLIPFAFRTFANLFTLS